MRQDHQNDTDAPAWCPDRAVLHCISAANSIASRVHLREIPYHDGLSRKLARILLGKGAYPATVPGSGNTVGLRDQ
ncbi:hypothetical protein ACLKMY_24920 [Paraburkholderia mimosarum]|uniref:hypothetical protein n=1 Tax=Paraburkholderia mimosarum TaxID=312026 RepID=UPI0039C34483